MYKNKQGNDIPLATQRAYPWRRADVYRGVLTGKALRADREKLEKLRREMSWLPN